MKKEIFYTGNSFSENETLKIGFSLINLIPSDIKLIILKGDLGVGKTVFVKGIAKSLNISDEITSPTFGFKKVYDGLVHYDLYMAKKVNKKMVLSLLMEDIEENLVVIEWGEKLKKIDNSILVEIQKINDFERVITIKEN